MISFVFLPIFFLSLFTLSLCKAGDDQQPETFTLQEINYFEQCISQGWNFRANVIAKINHVHPENGKTLLHYAMFSSNQEVTNFLIENGIDVERYDRDGFLGVHYINTVSFLSFMIERDPTMLTDTCTQSGVSTWLILGALFKNNDEYKSLRQRLHMRLTIMKSSKNHNSDFF